MHRSNSATRGRFYGSLDSNIVVHYSVFPIITIHGRITARECVDRLGNQVHPMIQMLFPNNDGVFQDDNAPIHTTGTVRWWFEEHEGKHHLPWPAQSSDLNIVESLWSVLKTRTRNRFPRTISVKQLEDVHQEEWYKIPLETFQNLYEFIPRWIAAIMKAKGGPTRKCTQYL
jgi:transposase